jgi:hypothetical protein
VSSHQIPADPDPGLPESGIYIGGPDGGLGDPYKPQTPPQPPQTKTKKHPPPVLGPGSAGGPGSGSEPPITPGVPPSTKAKPPPKPPEKPKRKHHQAIIRAEKQPPIPTKPDQFPWHALRYPPVFRFLLRRAFDGSVVPLENVISVTWDDNSALVTGNIQVQDTTIEASRRQAGVAQGDQIACQVDVHDGQGFKQLWLMRTKSSGLTYSDGSRTFDLANDLQLLQESEGVFRYSGTGQDPHTGPHTGHHPVKRGGWMGRDIILDICDRYKVPVGAMYEGFPEQKIGNFYRAAPMSPLEAIKAVVNIEFQKFKRRLTTRWFDGAFYVTPLRRSEHLRALGPTLIEAAFKSELRPEFTSVLTLHGLPLKFTPNKNDPGGHTSHIMQGGSVFPSVIVNSKVDHTTVTRESTAAVSRFGYVRKILYDPDARTLDDLTKHADDYLSIVAKPKKTLQLTLPGIPYIYRGDAIRLGLGDTALRNQLVWVSAITNTITPQQYLQTLTIVFDDPFVNHADLAKVWRLKKTHAEATAFRVRADGLFYWAQPTTNNKGDKNVKGKPTHIAPSGDFTTVAPP